MNTVRERTARMQPQIALVSPMVRSESIDVDAILAPFRADGLRFTNSFIDSGPTSIETDTDVAACLPGLLATSARVVREGCTALVINCMCDPGLVELRSRYTLPIFGPAETSMHAAASMGRRFSMLDVVSGGRELVADQVARYGLRRNFVSHRAIDVPVLELYADPERTLALLEAQALAAFTDGADTVILGCTGLADLANRLRGVLRNQGAPSNVMEPLGTTLSVAQALVKSGGRDVWGARDRS